MQGAMQGEIMMVRRILFVMLMAVASALGVLSAEPAKAVTVITASFDTEVAHPGDAVNLTITFTNPETVDVTFTYTNLIEEYDSITDGIKFSGTGCTGEISDSCNHYTVPIAPGATRTMTWPFTIAPDSPCGENKELGLSVYNYRESTAGAFDLIQGGDVVTILCATQS
ncbi:MAG TPA: hypothetical protein VF069_01255 [Streptosporangiaceae bacterium]